MKQNHYECVVIINAALEDEQVNSIVTKIEDHLKTNQCEIVEVDRWGRKRLAYPIQKSKSGFYVVFHFVAQPNIISGMERMFRLDENIIRYLTVLLDQKALDFMEKEKERKEKAASIEAEPSVTEEKNSSESVMKEDSEA